jgi:hypothetical protein
MATDETSLEPDLGSVGTNEDGRPGEPIPFSIDVSGTVNDESVDITGAGVVPVTGVYEATLNFSRIPQGFHPSAISIAHVSICCATKAASRNGAKNIAEMGASGYDTDRTVSLPGEYDGEVDIWGEVSSDGSSFGFEGEIDGEMALPDDVGGNSMYFQRFVPFEDGTVLTGTAMGSLFRSTGEEVKLRLDEEHSLQGDLSDPLTEPEFRVVTESGHLEGRTYRTVVHSIVDDENAMAKLVDSVV